MRCSRGDALRGIGAGVAALAAPVRARAASPTVVRLGATLSQSDAPLCVAIEKGYFAQAGLDVQITQIDTAAKMIAPVGAGQLDVGAGAPTAGLFNAVGRGIDIKMVASESISAPGYGVIAVLVRKDLIDRGTVKSFKDFRGLTFAEVGQGTAAFVTMSEALRRGGLTYHDVHEVYLGFPEQIVALQNGSIDASTTIEPFATKAIELGVAVRFSSSDVLIPNGTNSCLFYGGAFIREQRDAATRFMVAYLRGLRFCAGALSGGRLAGPNAADVIAILTKYTPIHDPAVFRAIVPNAVDVNGRLDLANLRTDLNVSRAAGLIEGDATVEQAVDTSFAEAALKVVGPYRPPANA
jgi:NitT/TauT family transport system substrate-binding protein